MRAHIVVLFTLLFALTCHSVTEYPQCGDCFCAPRDGNPELCPKNAPPSHFSELTVELFQRVQPSQIYTLDCNPYTNTSCTTQPKQNYVDLNTAVCAFQDWDCSSYAMETFKTAEAARAAGARVTHAGSCGLCSTAQDLSIYLKQDFTTQGKKCASLALIKGEASGLECYQELGLTLECARIWNYDGMFDGKACGHTCVGDLTAPNNGPPPTCALNDCLQCDEDLAGPIFSQYAARTRRRSGLLSEIIRDCDSIAKDIDHDPTCDSV